MGKGEGHQPLNLELAVDGTACVWNMEYGIWNDLCTEYGIWNDLCMEYGIWNDLCMEGCSLIVTLLVSYI